MRLRVHHIGVLFVGEFNGQRCGYVGVGESAVWCWANRNCLRYTNANSPFMDFFFLLALGLILLQWFFSNAVDMQRLGIFVTQMQFTFQGIFSFFWY